MAKGTKTPQPEKVEDTAKGEVETSVEGEVNQEQPVKEERAPKEAKAKQLKEKTPEPELFPEEKLLVLKLGSVDVPVVEDGKGFFKNVTQAAWNLDYQRALFAYWEDVARENAGFSVAAKKAKLFMPSE